jgi:hypothetical protein
MPSELECEFRMKPFMAPGCMYIFRNLKKMPSELECEFRKKPYNMAQGCMYSEILIRCHLNLNVNSE